MSNLSETEITIRKATLTVTHGDSEVITADCVTGIYEGNDDLLPLFQAHDSLMNEIVGTVNYELRMEREADVSDDALENALFNRAQLAGMVV